MTAKAPKLIPVYAHRYVAEIDGKELPVFSICGTDLIYYARDIADYFLIEFHEKENDIVMNDEVRYVPFWSDLL